MLTKFWQIRRSIVKHLMMRNYHPYERVLRHFRDRGDIWMVSQGEYMSWWVKRENATLKITVSDGTCRIDTSLENAVIEKFPGEFLNSPAVCHAETTFSGEVWLMIDSRLGKKELLIELLKREGILNFKIAETGTLMLSQANIGPLLDDFHDKLHRRGRFFEEDMPAFRQIIIDELAAHHLPLLRVWYHPRVNGVVTKAVFSPRYDVDRAITNLPKIRALEQKYDTSSTLYLRPFGPFYGDKEIKELVTMPGCSEIALHGEFTTNARKYGDEFKAAAAEKEHLEKLIGHPVLGVCMHGGELTSNTNKNTPNVVQKTGFLYDTTGSMHYYFPFKQGINGQLSRFYSLLYASYDVKLPANRHYSRTFYEQTVAKMDEIYQQHGIFVLMLHPVYFGFWAYLFNPKNWRTLARFFASYIKNGARKWTEN